MTNRSLGSARSFINTRPTEAVSRFLETSVYFVSGHFLRFFMIPLRNVTRSIDLAISLLNSLFL